MKQGYEMTRQELIEALRTADEDMNALNNLFNTIPLMEDKMNRLEEKCLEDHGGIGKAIGRFMLWYVILAMASIPFATSYETFTPIFTLCIIGGIVIAAITPGLKHKAAFNRYAKYSDKYHKTLEDIDNQRKTYVESKPEIYGFLPSDYAYASVMEKLLEYLKNMRADSLKEALNLYELENRAEA